MDSAFNDRSPGLSPSVGRVHFLQSAAAVSLLPVMGFKDPLDTITLLIPGIVIDLGFMISPRFVVSFWALALLGAFAHATKPIAKLLVSLGSGFPYPSLVAGVVYPVSLHALFGAAGAILAAISVKLFRSRRVPPL